MERSGIELGPGLNEKRQPPPPLPQKYSSGTGFREEPQRWVRDRASKKNKFWGVLKNR